jgi:UPF0271 protein
VRIVQGESVIAHDGSEIRLLADTLCIHGDTPGSAKIAAAVAAALREAGVNLHAMTR